MISKKANNFSSQTCKLSKLKVLLGVYTYIVRNLVRRNVKETDIPECNSQLAKLPILVKGEWRLAYFEVLGAKTLASRSDESELMDPQWYCSKLESVCLFILVKRWEQDRFFFSFSRVDLITKSQESRSLARLKSALALLCLWSYHGTTAAGGLRELSSWLLNASGRRAQRESEDRARPGTDSHGYWAELS